MRTPALLCLPAWCLSILLLSGCLGQTDDCGGPDGPRGDFGVYGFKLDSATVAWGLDSVPLHSATVGSDSPAVGDCQLSVDAGMASGHSNPTICVQKERSATVHLDCVATTPHPIPPSTVDYSSMWHLHISYLGNPSTWNAGDLVSTAWLSQRYPSSLQNSPGCQFSPGSLTSGSQGFRVVVEETVGGMADSPQFVATDFRRVFRIDVDTTKPLPGDTCQVVATMTMSLRLTLTADDFTIRDQSCSICE
jgi:hypothetical protein